MTLPTAHDIQRKTQGTPADRVVLSFDDRFLRRKVLTTEGGEDFLIDLAHTESLGEGDAFVLGDGRLVAVAAAVEPLLEVTGDAMPRIAWHIGNRHTPCQIETARLLIQRDHVIADMLSRIGATVREVDEPFTPEGGAYGHGRTHGHDHSHQHGPDTHVHADGTSHSHAHGSHTHSHDH